MKDANYHRAAVVLYGSSMHAPAMRHQNASTTPTLHSRHHTRATRITPVPLSTARHAAPPPLLTRALRCVRLAARTPFHHIWWRDSLDLGGKELYATSQARLLPGILPTPPSSAFCLPSQVDAFSSHPPCWVRLPLRRFTATCFLRMAPSCPLLFRKTTAWHENTSARAAPLQFSHAGGQGGAHY